MLHGRDVIAGVEDADVEFIRRARRKKPQHVHGLAAMSHDRHVVRDADHDLRVDPFRVRDAAEDGHLQDFVGALDEPRRSAFQPVIGFLVLESVDECLAEESELVVDAVAKAGIVERGQRIEEARRESAEAAVA